MSARVTVRSSQRPSDPVRDVMRRAFRWGNQHLMLPVLGHPALALPGRVVEGTATPVLDPAEAERAALAVARNCGFALVFEGLNPVTVSDDRLRAQLAGRPVVRVTAPEPVRPGRHDPGSSWWLLPRDLGVVTVLGAARAARRR